MTHATRALALVLALAGPPARGYQLGRRSHAPSSLRRRTVVASGSGGTNPVGPTSGIAGAGGAPASATTSTAAAVMSPASLIAWELDDSALGQSSGARFWPVTCEGLKLGAMPLWAVSTGAFAFDNGAVAAALRGEAVREDVPGIPEAFMIHNVLSSSECERMIKIAEELSFCLFDKGKNIQGALTWVLDDASIDVLFERCRPAMPSRVRGTSGGGGPAADGDGGVSGGGGGEGAILTRAKAEPVVVADEGDDDAWALVGLNQRCRFYRYQDNEHDTFKPHRDDSSPGSGFADADRRNMRWDNFGGERNSLLTYLLYLNDDFDGGETTFLPDMKDNPEAGQDPGRRVPVRPRQGSVLIFPQTCSLGADGVMNPNSPFHEGSIVRKLLEGDERGEGRPKYIMRSDVLYTSPKAHRAGGPALA